MKNSLPLDYPVRNLGRRPARTLLNGLACALVAAILVATVAFVQGLENSFKDQGRDDVAILISTAAMRDLLRSAVSPAVANLVAADVPGIAQVNGTPAVSAEIHMGTNIRLGPGESAREDEPQHAGFVRGVTDRAFLVHDAVTLLDGTLPGPNEIIVGRLVASQLGVPEERLAPGRTLRFEGAEFTIAGRFAAPGTTIESEIWAPLFELQGHAQRDDVSAVFVRVQTPDDLADVDAFAQRRLDLELLSIPSATYYRELAAYFEPIRMLAVLMALVIAVTVIVTGANTLNAAVQDRMGELATLRAIGYPVAALIRALSLEALLLAASGGVLGLLLARIAVDDASFRIGMGAFALEVSGACVVTGFSGVLLLGLFGTLPAALRIARLSVAAALKPD